MDLLSEGFCILRELVSQDFTSTLGPLALITFVLRNGAHSSALAPRYLDAAPLGIGDGGALMRRTITGAWHGEWREYLDNSFQGFDPFKSTER